MLKLEQTEGTRLDINERELRKKIIAGDKEAMGYFFNAYAARLYNFVFQRVNGNVHDAKDITQEACVKAIKALPSFRGNSSLYTWICTIAVNLIHDAYKATTKNVKMQTDYPWIVNEPSHEHNVEQLKKVVKDAISALPVHYQQILEAKYTLKLSQQEISRKIGISEKAVESLLVRARNAVRTQVEKLYGGE